MAPLFNLRLLSMMLILIALWVFFRLQVGEFYFSGESIAKLSRDMATWTILAAGATLIIISGHIDLSVGSLLALVAASCAFMINPEYGLGWSATAAVPLVLLLGAALGCGQGFLVAYLRIPAFIVTLGGLFIFRGLTLRVSAFDPRIPDSSWVASLGFQYVPASIGWILGILACIAIAFLLLRDRARGGPSEHLLFTAGRVLGVSIIILGFITKVNDYRGIPNQTVIMIGVLIVLALVSRRTAFGRHLYAIGGNVEAARLAGIRVERKVVILFGLMGTLAAVAGVIWMAQNQGSTKNAGEFYELYAIAAAVIGGSSLMGGRGTILGTFLGGLVLATVIQGMDYMNLENWMQLAVRGGLLVIAVGIDVATKNPPAWLRNLRRGRGSDSR